MTVIAAASDTASKLTASKDRRPSAIMVIFGAGGDLTKRLVTATARVPLKCSTDHNSFL
jgi:hypothetical protein